MTSLPLFWPLDAEMADLASARAEIPWQRQAIEQRYEIVPLDTLSPIAGIAPDDPEIDPLVDLERIAIIQPRGLSPADNVALDEWVRAGGQLLLVLDPLLTGEYELPLGDPRRPVDSALIPPVVKRWGLEVSFDPEDSANNGIRTAEWDSLTLFLMHGGNISISDPESGLCELAVAGFVSRCRVDKGTVTLLADAAMFEHVELGGEAGNILLDLLTKSFD